MGQGRTRFGAVLAALVVASGGAWASSHREAPLISNDPAVDNTDVYAWRIGSGKDARIVLVANLWPLAAPAGGPNFFRFDETARYTIKIDNNGDSQPDVMYELKFSSKTDKSILKTVVNGDSFLYAFAPVKQAKDDPNLFREDRYSLVKIKGDKQTKLGEDLPVAPWPVGNVTTPDYDAIAKTAIVTLGSTKVFVGPRDDPFFADLHRTFDFLAYDANNAIGPKDDLAGLNVLSIVIEVPASDVVANEAAITDNDKSGKFKVGIWSTVDRRATTVAKADGTRTTSGDWVQVSRLGNPLINEVIVPMKFKDFFNASKPKDDKQFVPVVLDPELPYLLQAKGFIPKVPPPPRNDLAKALATPSETLHLDLSVPPSATENRMGILANDPAGFPNGRRLADDVVDISLQVVGGVAYKLFGAQKADDTTDYAAAASKLSDGVNGNDSAFLTTFPYLASPWQGNPPAAASPGATPAPTKKR